MTQSLDQGSYDAAGTARPAFTLPLVSVIVVNYNYGRYLKDAVDSVFSQSYANIECIVVDNASTDDSRAVLDDLTRTYPALRTLFRATNGGQNVASAEGFKATTGAYVVFLDADDYLLPQFLATHVYVHLSMRINVGLSCSDMIQTRDREFVLGTFFTVNDFIRSETKREANLLRGFVSDQEVCLGATVSTRKQLCAVGEDEVYFYDRNRDKWPWAATSSFFFRRDAVALIIDNPRMEAFGGCLDVYLARGVHVLTGSVIIDKALTIYRMHGDNIFSRYPHLNSLINYDRGGDFDKELAVRSELITFFLAQASFFLKKFQNRDEFLGALIALNDGWPGIPSVSGGRSFLADQILRNRETIVAIIGHGAFLQWCRRLRLPKFDRAKLTLQAWRRRS